MTNKELLDMLTVSGVLTFDINEVNKGIFDCFVNNQRVWNLESSLRYIKLICKLLRLQDEREYINKFIRSELLNGYPIFSKTVYNTLILTEYLGEPKELPKFAIKKILTNKIRSTDEFHEISVYNNFYWNKVLDLWFGINLGDSNYWNNVVKMHFNDCLGSSYVNNVDSVTIMKLKEQKLMICLNTILEYDFETKEMKNIHKKVVKFSGFDSINWSKVPGINVQNFDIMF